MKRDNNNETLKLTCCTQRFDKRSIVMTLKDTQDGSEIEAPAYQYWNLPTQLVWVRSCRGVKFEFRIS